MKYIVSMYSSTGIQKELGLGNGSLKEGFWNSPGIPLVVHSLRTGLHSVKWDFGDYCSNNRLISFENPSDYLCPKLQGYPQRMRLQRRLYRVYPVILTNSVDCKRSLTLFLFQIYFINVYNGQTKSKERHTYKFA